MTLQPFAIYSQRRAVDHRARRAARLPDPDDDRRAALGDRHRRHGPARAAQRARDVAAARSRPRATARRCCSTRPARSPTATARRPSSSRCRGVDERDARRRRAALEPRRRDARGPLDRRARRGALRPRAARASPDAELVPFTAQTRMSGVDFDGRAIRKGAADSVRRWVDGAGRRRARRARRRSSTASRRSGGTPLVVADGRPRARRDPPQGHREAGHARALRPSCARMGIRTVMITGDNPLTAAAIADGGRRRRLPRRGHARGQDGADQARAGRAAASSR